MAIRAEKGRLVRLVYRLTDSDGRLIEERTPDSPYEYVQGAGQIVGPVERAVEGKTAGFQAEVLISPHDEYGDYNPALVAEIPRAKLPADVEIGAKFNTIGADGKPMTVRVIELDEKTVTVDGNHPLAGLELTFDLRVVDVVEGPATEAEDVGSLVEAPPVTLKVTKRSPSDVH